MGIGILENKSRKPVPGTVHLLLDDNGSRTTKLALVKSKRDNIVLAPQPSDDPNDPLNWSSLERHSVLLVVLLGCIIISMSPLVMLHTAMVKLTEDLHTSYTNIARLSGYLLLASGITAPFVAAMTRKFGKRPMYVICSFVGLASNVLGIFTYNYKTLVVVKILQGIGMTSYETVITASIGDLFFVHERGPRVAVVHFTIMVLGNIVTIIGGIITHKFGWRTNFHTLLPFTILVVVLVVLFVPETAFRRSSMPVHGSARDLTADIESMDLSPVNSVEHPGRIDEKKQSVTVEQVPVDDKKKSEVILIERVESTPSLAPRPPKRRRTFVQRMSVFNGTLTPDSVFKMVGACVVIFSNVGVLHTIFISSIVMAWHVVANVIAPLIFSAAPYHLNPAGIGYTSVGTLIGGLLSALFMSTAQEPFVRWMTRRNRGIYEPEIRLMGIFFGCAVTVAGLSGFGHAIAAKQSIYLVCFAQGVMTFGSMIIMVATSAYVLDAFAMYAVEIFMMNMTTKNFLFYGMSNVIVKWYRTAGPAAMFDMMAGATVAACLLTVPMYIFGKRYREYWAKHDMIKILKLDTDKTTV